MLLLLPVTLMTGRAMILPRAVRASAWSLLLWLTQATMQPFLVLAETSDMNESPTSRASVLTRAWSLLMVRLSLLRTRFMLLRLPPTWALLHLLSYVVVNRNAVRKTAPNTPPTASPTQLPTGLPSSDFDTYAAYVVVSVS